ncbi:MAG: DUF5667 domain-containing protein [Labedaea sp.]
MPGPEGPAEVDERVVAHLVRRLAPLTAPDQLARNRMRERILAGLVTPEPSAASGGPAPEPAAPAVPTMPVSPISPPSKGSRAPRNRSAGDRGSTRPGDLPRAGTGARGRFVIAAVALLALVLSLTGMSLLLARDALPGDALYGIKRTAEAASLGLTFGDEPKALKHLEFASARLTEIETLASRYPNPADAPAGGYLTALSDFDNDAAAGSRQLIALATRDDGRQLDALRAWAGQQANRLAALSSRLPDPAHTRQVVTLALLSRIAGRADDLLTRMQCYQITTGSFDDIGALPATGVCERIPAPPVQADPGGTTTGAGNGPPTGAPPATATGAAQSVPTSALPLPGPPQPPTTGPPKPGLPSVLRPPVASVTVPPVIVLPLPTVELPPLLPGLPGVRLGG